MQANHPQHAMLAMQSTDQLDALELIGYGSIEAKVGFIATHAPDELDEVLDWRAEYVDRDATRPTSAPRSTAHLDAIIARIALGSHLGGPLPHAA
ncbi:MAG: hypothetical protein JWM86_1963 [Thermoleophilia bacterium]|nr:hypothetical protein [Thermoleophilia bacterium]